MSAPISNHNDPYDLEDDFEDDFEQNDPSDHGAILKTLHSFGQRIGHIAWYQNLGTGLNPECRDLADHYLQQLGFPDCQPLLVRDWLEASDAAESLDWNSPSWEAEEHYRSMLTAEAVDILGEEALEIAMMSLQEIAAPILEQHILDAARYQAIQDETFLRAANGAALRAIYLAALVLITGQDQDHPFALKFQLFEQGRWPLDIVGQSFNIY